MADKNRSSGSPTGEPVHLAIGFIRRPHGVQGEMIMDVHTDFPERIKSGRKVLVGEKHQPLTFDTVRPHGNGLLVSFRGVDTPEDAGRFRNHWVYVKVTDVPPLPEGQHYQYELVGLDVADENGNLLGKLTEIIETGANDVYVVRDETGKEILLPAIPSVILNRDMDRRLLTVHLLDGLV
jgi:16S rRNA processing protein RimM